MQYLTLESHFWVIDHAIRPDTRNICSKELVSLIYRVASIIAPEEKIEVLILPSEIWSYKDVFKITWGLSIVSILWAVWWYLNYKDSHERHQIDMFHSCREEIQRIENITWWSFSISEDKIYELCEDYGIKKNKNTRYKTLEEDHTVEYEETVIKTQDRQNVFQSTIQRQDFQKMIVPLPESEEYEEENIKWTIELISLVVKQKKEGRGIPWKWSYFWDDIIYQGIKVLENNEDIDFFMQDEEFKQKIKNQEIQFSSWDNIEVEFKMKVEIYAGIVKTRKIYIKKVLEFNEQEIPHSEKIRKKEINSNQIALFDISSL